MGAAGASLEDGIKDAYSLEFRGGDPRRVTRLFSCREVFFNKNTLACELQKYIKIKG